MKDLKDCLINESYKDEMPNIFKKLGGDRISEILHASYPEEAGYEAQLDAFDRATSDEEAIKIMFTQFPCGVEFVNYLKSLID